jgi:hypothetical protein
VHNKIIKEKRFVLSATHKGGIYQLNTQCHMRPGIRTSKSNNELELLNRTQFKTPEHLKEAILLFAPTITPLGGKWLCN